MKDPADHLLSCPDPRLMQLAAAQLPRFHLRKRLSKGVEHDWVPETSLVWTVVLIAAMLLSCGNGWGHSTQYYLSTPFSPPLGIWLLIPPLFIVACAAWSVYLTRGKMPTLVAVRYTIILLIPGSIVAWMFGVLASGLNTAPPPGFGLPSRVFSGAGLADVGIMWAVANVLSVIVLAPFMEGLGRKLRLRGAERRKLTGGLVLIYLLCLALYLPGNAMTHGWHGGYVGSSCRHNREILKKAILVHAELTGRLPSGETLESVMPVIRPHISEGFANARKDLVHCPAEALESRHPRPYEWDTELNGMLLKDYLATSASRPMLRCPRSDHNRRP